MKRAIIYSIIILTIALVLFFVNKKQTAKAPDVQPPITPTATNINSVSNSNSSSPKTNNEMLAPPLDNAGQRITKKKFGDYITPQTSPVQPEKFFGYHTGVDFEILPGEENLEVPVGAVCMGKLVYANYVSGYGGVAIQECQLDNSPITVLYGHLKLASISAKVGSEIKIGDKIGILGQGYSVETDGERKHLHLAFHKGSAIELRGYVQNQSELDNWLNPYDYGVCK